MVGTEQPLSEDDATAEVLARWQTLITEHEALRDALREHVQQPHWPGVGPCISMLKTEAATVARLLAAQTRLRAADSRQDDGKAKPGVSKEEEAVVAKLAASNLSAREVAWGAIKKRSGLLALDRRFPKLAAGRTNGTGPAKLGGGGVRYSGGRTEGVFVNAVVDDGREWLRILTTTESQLLMEMAENGWEFEGREGGDENQDGNADNDNNGLDLDHISIVSATIGLVQASQANRFRGAPPRVCILLSRISEGGKTGWTADLDVLLRLFRQRVQAVGSAVDVTVTVYSTSSAVFTSLPPPLDVALERLMPAITAIGGDGLSATLNIDTSILIALASDITHGPVAIEPWHPRQRVDEITREIEKPGDVLRRLLNDVLRGRRLVCTREAARAFRDMVCGMGQQTERARAAVLVGDEEAETGTQGHQNSHSFLSTYRSLSSYPDVIPDDLRLPITIVADGWDVVRIRRAVDEKSLPVAAASVVHEMTAVLPTAVPTLAVFFYGWASHYTTITTNMAAKNRIERLLEQFRTSPDEDGPAVWVCRSVRSLNGTNPRSQR